MKTCANRKYVEGEKGEGDEMIKWLKTKHNGPFLTLKIITFIILFVMATQKKNVLKCYC